MQEKEEKVKTQKMSRWVIDQTRFFIFICFHSSAIRPFTFGPICPFSAVVLVVTNAHPTSTKSHYKKNKGFFLESRSHWSPFSDAMIFKYWSALRAASRWLSWLRLRSPITYYIWYLKTSNYQSYPMIQAVPYRIFKKILQPGPEP